jgi:hypothetical protein
MPELLRPAILELLSTLFAKAMFNGSQKINYHRRKYKLGANIIVYLTMSLLSGFEPSRRRVYQKK